MPESSKTPETAQPVDQMTFEAAMAELEKIVAALERGEVPLAASIDLYERGQKLKERCDDLLRQADARIEKITLSADGAASGTTPLDDA